MMAYDYNKLYGETPDALGSPTAVIVDFFNRYERQNARVLDVGCGQGRDAVFLARRGHRVVGVDLASNGIRDLQAVAAKETLAIEGIIADITHFVPSGLFDIILIDRTLHMLARTARSLVLSRLLDHVSESGWVLIADEQSNINEFQAVIAAHRRNWITDYQKRGHLFVRQVGG